MTFLPALFEFYANAHLETPGHSSSSSRIEQPTGSKDAFHVVLRCSGTGQVLTSRASREGPLACQRSKALTLRVTPASTSARLLGLGLGLEAKFSGLGLGLETSGLGLGLGLEALGLGL